MEKQYKIPAPHHICVKTKKTVIFVRVCANKWKKRDKDWHRLLQDKAMGDSE